MEDLTEREYRFEELSEPAKQAARERLIRDGNYPFYEWWSDMFDTMREVGDCMGVSMEDIRFSGFCSQGDGASFKGNFTYTPDMNARLAAFYGANMPGKIQEIANMLTGLCAPIWMARRLADDPEDGDGLVRATITYSGGLYVHENTMSVDLDEEMFIEDDEFYSTERALRDIMRELAKWIYDELEQEYDSIMSDEQVDEFLSQDYLFTEDGDIQ